MTTNPTTLTDAAPDLLAILEKILGSRVNTDAGWLTYFDGALTSEAEAVIARARPRLTPVFQPFDSDSFLVEYDGSDIGAVTVHPDGRSWNAEYLDVDEGPCVVGPADTRHEAAATLVELWGAKKSEEWNI